MRKHGWFRPHVRGLTAISSTTLREGGGWWIPGSQLDLDFANDRSYNRLTGYNATPNGLLTYTSPSPKMVYGDDGVLGYAPHNLLLQSQTFDNAYWTKNSGGISANAGVSPSSLADADKLIGVASATQQWVYKTSITVANGVSHTVSCYMKADGYNFGQLRILTGGTNANVGFNLSTGEIYSTAAGSGTITDIGGGWYRCTATGTSDSTSAQVYINVTDTASLSKPFTGDGTSGILIWGAQLSLGSSALTYIPTTTAAVYSLPIDHNPTTFAPLGVLIEEQRTNLLLQSQTFATTWNTQRCSVSSDAAVGGDGTQTADAFVEDSASGAHQLYQTVTKAASSIQYALSVEIEPQNRTWCRLQASTGGEVNYASTWFNLSGSGSVGTSNAGGAGFTNNSSSITLLPNGRYKLVLVFTSDTGTSVTVGIKSAESDGSLAHVGNSLTAFYLWGAQLEAGAFATSYIQTGSAQVTRAADQVSLATSAFNFSASAGTLVVEATPVQVSASCYVAALDDGTGNELTAIRIISDRWRLLVLDNTVQQASIDIGSAQVGAEVAAAIAYAADDFAGARNGSAALTDTGGTVPTPTSLKVGYIYAGGQFNGRIKRLTYWNSRKPDAELQALSA